MPSLTDAGGGSTNELEPTPVTPSQYSITVHTVDTSVETSLWYTITPDVSGWIRVDAIESTALSPANSSAWGRVQEGVFWSEVAVPGAADLTNDRCIFVMAGQPTLIEVIPSLLLQSNYTTLEEAYIGLNMVAYGYPTLESFETVVIQVYGTADNYLTILNNGGTETDGVGQFVVRFSEIVTWEELDAMVVTHSGTEDWEALPVGQIGDDWPNFDDYKNGLLEVETNSPYNIEIDTYRKHSGTRSARRASPHLPGASASSGFIEVSFETGKADVKNRFFGLSPNVDVDPYDNTYGRIECWTYLNSTYPNSPYWQINNYFYGLEVLGLTLAYPKTQSTYNNQAIRFSVNDNGRSGGPTIPSPYATQTVSLFINRQEDQNAKLREDYHETGISPWDRWLKYVVECDIDLGFLRVELHDDDQMLWEYETPTENFINWGADRAFKGWWLPSADFASLGNSVPAGTQVMPNQFFEWHDDFAWEFGRRWPMVPELGDVPLPSVTGRYLLDRRRFS